MRSGCGFVILCLLAVSPSRAQETPRAISDFGIRIQQGKIVHPLPPNVALGLYNPDPLQDVAIVEDGLLSVFQNLGNGLFEQVWECTAKDEVRRIVWQHGNIVPIMRWGILEAAYSTGYSEIINFESMATQSQESRNLLPDPPINFVERWRGDAQTQPGTYLAIDDIDNDGRMEVAYCFFAPGSPDTNRFVVYECVGNDSFVVEWDTVLTGGFGPLGPATDLDQNGLKEWVIITDGVSFLESEGDRQYRYYPSNIVFVTTGYITKSLQCNLDGDNRMELCVQQANPSPPSGGDGTVIYRAEFLMKAPGPNGLTMVFNYELVRYGGYTFEMDIGQVDGQGWDEIIPAGGSFGISQPVPVEYLWHNGVSWQVRGIHTGLRSGSTAPIFLNMDSDRAEELFIGAVGPIGYGSCYALDHVADTTWQVMWVDSSLRNTPLWVNSGVLQGAPIVAGANTFYRSPTVISSQLHCYTFPGFKLGVWEQDSSSMQNFHFPDIDHDGITNLIYAQLSNQQGDRVMDFEEAGPSEVADPPGAPDEISLYQNYPNPFNHATSIRYTLPWKARVRVSVLDILGREVAELVDMEQGAGTHEVRWHGTETDDGSVSSGVYFVRLRAVDAYGNGATSLRKMVLLK